MRAFQLDGTTIINIIEVDSLIVIPNLVSAVSNGTIGDSFIDGLVVKYIPELAPIKVAKNTQINEWRGAANQSTFTHAGKTISCDALSRSDIDAVAGSIALNGAFPAGFPGGWKATDNSYLSLPDIASFKSMYNSMTLQGTSNFGHSQTLKTALAAATTLDQINAIVW